MTALLTCGMTRAKHGGARRPALLALEERKAYEARVESLESDCFAIFLPLFLVRRMPSLLIASDGPAAE